MVKATFECKIHMKDDDSNYEKEVTVKQDNVLKFNIDFHLALLRLATEAASYAKIAEKEKMEQQGELPF